MNKIEKRNNQILIAIVIAIMPIMNLFAQNGNNSNGPHNGTIKKVKSYHIETLIKDSKVYFFILDEKLKPLSNTEITGTASLIFADGKSKKVELANVGIDTFIVNEISAHTYTDIQVSFKINGKSISTIFSKERKLERFSKEITKHYHEQSTEHSYK
ncbi:hypothetical protein [Flavobacterium luminosum]|jgi:hypothetical protein|uniref:DUF4369 domain-containing protein n=1 Tax=Flavobacterium luminosum TaxID=2949086 RepID=A0ABT0TQR6_9FLAO|nr:hypothetical protein [Flavobacterium sp. HXWNR70]MCL9809838.1 hypothetical protein [Flavobacterium sp. HXWNR70]